MDNWLFFSLDNKSIYWLQDWYFFVGLFQIEILTDIEDLFLVHGIFSFWLFKWTSFGGKLHSMLLVEIPKCLSHDLSGKNPEINKAIFNWVSKGIRDWIVFALLRYVSDWSRKLALPSHPIRCITKTNRDLVTYVPALKAIYMFDWPLWLLWFWFYGDSIENRSITCYFQHYELFLSIIHFFHSPSPGIVKTHKMTNSHWAW